MAVLSQMENSEERQRKRERRRLFHLDIPDLSLRQHRKLCRTAPCFQMLHRLVPPLYNRYVTFTADPDASALLLSNLFTSTIDQLISNDYMKKMEEKKQLHIEFEGDYRCKRGRAAVNSCFFWMNNEREACGRLREDTVTRPSSGACLYITLRL